MVNPIENGGLFTPRKDRFSGKGEKPQKLGCLKNYADTFHVSYGIRGCLVDDNFLINLSSCKPYFLNYKEIIERKKHTEKEKV